MNNPTTGTYFLIEQTIIYTLDSEAEKALDHIELWPKLIHRVFSQLSFEDRVDLILNATYGADRGRVVYKNDQFFLYGTPGSETFKDQLLEIFGLQQNNTHMDFRTDPHYRVNAQDKTSLMEMMKLHNLELKAGSLHLQGLKRLTKRP